MFFFVSFSWILFLVPACLAEKCEQINETSGEISDSTSHTKTSCWSLAVPQDSYIRLYVKELNFKSRSCSQSYLKIDVAGTKENFTYCSHNTNRKPVTALSDLNVTYYHYRNGFFDGESTSFKLNFTVENLICAHNDHFRCSLSKCIHIHQVCDGVKDCENGTDEVGCEKGILAVKGMNVSHESSVTWLRNQRSTSFGWGENTHRAITALYLAKAVNFTSEDLEEELMVKQLELQTSVALLRNSTDPISVSELSMFVNALQVTCHNSRNFYGYDLLKILGERASVAEPPSASAYLTLCNSNWTFTESDLTRVFKFLQKPSKYPFISDVQAVAVMAISCMKRQAHLFRSRRLLYNEAIRKFVNSQLPDGSFGNVYTTALVTQALISSGQEENKQWNVTATAHYLMKQLNSSSVDFLSTYLTLPIFSGRSLVDVSTVDCSNITRKQDDSDISDVTNKLGGKMQVQYSLYVGDQKNVIHTMILRMPENSTAYDVMRVAQVADSKYKFLHRDVSGQMYVYDIAGITNDPEAGKFWLLYLKDDNANGTLSHHTESPDKLVLGYAEHLIMWYKTAEI